MQLNTYAKEVKAKTHEGGPAERNVKPVDKLRRMTMSCLLWEGSFYIDGQEIAKIIEDICASSRITVDQICAVALEARRESKLRHVPLLLIRYAVKRAKTRKDTKAVEEALVSVIERVDQIPEFLTMYWKDGKCSIAHSVKRGLSRAFQKFDSYQLAKYDRDNPIKLRDVLFLIHAKPLPIKADEVDLRLRVVQHEPLWLRAPAINKPNYKRGDTLRHLRGQGETWGKLVRGELETPDTWEVELSAGGGKKKAESWTRLLEENKLGALALIRNLRNMVEAGVDPGTIRHALNTAKADKILPFQFITAARYAPRFETEIEKMMLRNLAVMDRLEGRTLLVIDTSPSMDVSLSEKSELMRVDAATGLAMFVAGIVDGMDVYTFNAQAKAVPPRDGFALRDAIMNAKGGSTLLGASLEQIARENPKQYYQRTIVITDEQSQDRPNIVPQCDFFYIINVGTYEHGVQQPNAVKYSEKLGAREVVKFHGFSENAIRFISEYEKRIED
jgi:hypothetical protein